MAYIGGTSTGEKPTYAVEIGTGLVDTTTTLVATNNYYIKGEVAIADTKTWDVAGSGTLNVI